MTEVNPSLAVNTSNENGLKSPSKHWDCRMNKQDPNSYLSQLMMGSQ